jgi:hypothetical protein
MKPFLRFFLLGFLAPCAPVLLALLLIQLGMCPNAVRLSDFLWLTSLFIAGAAAWVLWRAWPRANASGGEGMAWRKIGGFAAGFFSPFVLLIGVLCLTIGLRETIFTADFIFLVPHNAGSFHRAEMESLVAQVRSQKFEGEKRFSWTEKSGIATLLPEPQTGPAYRPESRWVEAERGTDLHLKVVIVTNDEGHAGTYGFAFSDVPLPSTPDANDPEDKSRLQLDVPSSVCFSHPRMQIDAHWWEVFDDLE